MVTLKPYEFILSRAQSNTVYNYSEYPFLAYK